jgi:hypothetical protein
MTMTATSPVNSKVAVTVARSVAAVVAAAWVVAVVVAVTTAAVASGSDSESGRGWFIFLDSTSWHTLYNFVNKKLSILIYRSISYIGIVIYILASTNTTHPTNIITMVSRLPLQRHGFGESAHPPPGASLEGVI